MTKNKSKARTKGAYPDDKAVRFLLEGIRDELTRVINLLPAPDPYADFLADLPPGFGDRHPDDPGPEVVVGQVKGKWAVQARVNYYYSAIQTVITGGKKARSGVNVGDRSVTLAGDDWRPLVAEAITEMQRRTGRLLSPGCSQFWGVGDVSAGPDDPEFLAFAKESFDYLSELADAPLPPLVH